MRFDSLRLLRLWIWISALATLAGWTLSAVGQLNVRGYVGFGAVTVVTMLVWRRASAAHSRPSPRRGFAPLKRFRNPLPAFFLLVAALVLIGGILYAPTNHTGLTYRLPRVLHWLEEGQWHWIHTPNYRMNNRACGIEWLSAPLVLFTRSDRLLFLLNYIPYLLLPGVLFSLFLRLGVRSRVAWHWMWLLPVGYVFVLQAGSIGNDAFPAIYAAAAVLFALRSRETRRQQDVWYSIMAAALLTGAKASNLPLLLPWALAVLPGLRLLTAAPFRTALILTAAGMVSFVPTAVLNVVYCGDWSGLVLERTGMAMRSPVVGVWGNLLLILLHNLVPPFFLFAAAWNQSALSFLPEIIVSPLLKNFEPGFHTVWELPTEDWAGLGFGVTAILVVSLLGQLFVRKHALQGPAAGRLVHVGTWISLLAYCLKSGMVMGARLIAPYYTLLVPALLSSGRASVVVRKRWWKLFMWCVLLTTLPVLAVNPPRPLWPALTVLSRLHTRYPENRLVTRAQSVYEVYRHRSDPLAAVRARIPSSETVVGFIGDGDDLDISLWRPYFTRRVEHFFLKDTPELIAKRGVSWAVVGGANLAASNMTIADWLARTGWHKVSTVEATLKAAEGSQQWHIVSAKTTAKSSNE